jgi:ribokinase
VQVASAARVPVVLDCGGADGPVSEELLQKVSVISPNETELARLTGRPTDSAAEISSAAGLLKQQQVRALALRSTVHIVRTKSGQEAHQQEASGGFVSN